MFNLNFYKKKFRKLLLSINKIIGSFFDELTRSKYPKIKRTPFKKNFTLLDQKIESFFDKFKGLKKYNQSKKILNVFEYKKTLILLLIFFSFSTYLILPSFYSKEQVEVLLKKQILDKYQLDIKFNDKINYGLFPKPFFYTKNLNINHKDKVLGNSSYVKFYISLSNLFSFKKIKVEDLVFKNTEFNIDIDNFNFFKKTLDNLKNKDKVIFHKSKLFYKDINGDLLFLSKIKKLSYFYDQKKQSQKVNSEFDIFNIPFKLNILENDSKEKRFVELSSKKIRFNLETSMKIDKSQIAGLVNLRLINKENLFEYIIKNDELNFVSENKNFEGDVNFKPFYLSTNLNFNYISQRKIFQNESLLIDLLDTELLNNPNLNAVFNIKIDKIDKFEYLTDLILSIVLDNGNILMNNLKTKWNNSVLINSNEIEFLNNQDGKKLVGEIIFDFEDVEKFFRYFQIKRNYRDVFERIRLDFVYDFTLNKLNLNNLKIDSKSDQKIDNFIEKYNKKNKNLFNKVTLRNFIKDFFQTYAG